MNCLPDRAPLRLWGAPFLLLLFLAASGSVLAAPGENRKAGEGPVTISAPGSIDTRGNTEPVRLRGDRLEFHREDQVIIGWGNVAVWMGDMTLLADHLHMDVEKNQLIAEGHVAWSEKGSTVYAKRVELLLETREGKAFGIDYRQEDWRATGDEAEKKGEDDIFLRSCQASSCFRENPHYRISASEIHVHLNERMTAKHVWLHVGILPVFYVPWFTRNLRDPRPPIMIRPGYSDRLGWNVQVTYNYFMNENHFGHLRYDYMEKWGHGEGFEHQYKTGRGQGKVGGYYTRNLADTEERWTGNLEHGHDLGHGRQLLGRLDLLSDSSVNDTFNQSQVDVSERRSFLSLRSNQSKYSWSVQAEDRQALSLDVQPNGAAKREYVTTRRQLPNATFNLNQQPLWEKGRLYYNLGANLGRLYTVPLDSASGRYLTETATTTLGAGWSPALTQTLRMNRQNSLSSRISVSQNFTEDEDTLDKAEILTSYGTSLNLRTSWRPGITSTFTHTFSQDLSRRDTLDFTGITLNQLSGRLNLGLLESLEFNLGQNMELRPYKYKYFRERLQLLRIETSLDMGGGKDIGANGQLDWMTGRLKTVDGFLNLVDPTRRWKINLTSSWVNNRIHLKTASDRRAAAIFGFENPRATPDLFLVSTRTSLDLTPKWKLLYFQRINVMAKKIDEHAITVWRDLHCWDLEFSLRQRIDGSFEYGFSLSLKAAPDVKASSNQLNDEFFSDAHFGVY